MVVPQPWNGDLVLYAKASGELLTKSAKFAGFRNALLTTGYAVAAWDLDPSIDDAQLGADRLEELLPLFSAQFRRPVHTFLTGASRGGLVAIAVAERNPSPYAGVLSLCGPIAGLQISQHARLTVRVLTSYFFHASYAGFQGVPSPAVAPVPGLLKLPPGQDPSVYQYAILKAFVDGLTNRAVPCGDGTRTCDRPTRQIARIANLPGFASSFDVAPSVVANLLPPSWRATDPSGKVLNDEIVSLLARLDAPDRVLVSMLASAFPMLMRAELALASDPTGGIPFDNTDDVYVGSDDDVALNLGVERVQGDPTAMQQEARYFTPSGDVAVPVVSLHSYADPTSRHAHEAIYARRAARAGRSDLVRQYGTTVVGHCSVATSASEADDFTERMAGFTALADRVHCGRVLPPSGAFVAAGLSPSTRCASTGHGAN